MGNVDSSCNLEHLGKVYASVSTNKLPVLKTIRDSN
jgi:hypothetical protein